MNAKIEKIQRNAYQNEDKHRTPTKNGKYTIQYSNNNRTTTLEGTLPKPPEVLTVFYERQIFVLDSIHIEAF